MDDIKTEEILYNIRMAQAKAKEDKKATKTEEPSVLKCYLNKREHTTGYKRFNRKK